MLNDVNNWKFFKNLKLYISEYKYHYKTIYNKFCLWTPRKINKVNFLEPLISVLHLWKRTLQDIFKNAFYNYKTLINTNLLLIDATSINNKYGSENIVINVEYKKKK